MALYKELAPGNVRYERKVYRYQPGFQPLFAHAPASVLAALTTGFGTGKAPAPGDVLLADDMHPNDLRVEGTCCCRADGALLIAWYDGEVSWISAAGALSSALIADRCVNVRR